MLDYYYYYYYTSEAVTLLCKRILPYCIGQLLILDLRAEEVGVGGLVAHGSSERADDGVQKLKDLVLVDTVPAVLRWLAQRALHGYQQGGDINEAAHLAENGSSAVTLAQHG